MTINDYAHHVERLKKDWLHTKSIAERTGHQMYIDDAAAARKRWQNATYYLRRRIKQEEV